MAKIKHPWGAIKKEYIEAVSEVERPTYRELSDKYGVPEGYLEQVAAAEKWTEQGKIFRRKIEENRKADKATTLASESAKWDSDCLRVAQASLAQITTHLRGAQNSKKCLELRELNLLATALEKIQKVGRTALGQSSENEVNIKVNLAELTDEQLSRIADGESVNRVVA
ncbi:MAG: hypothetical protein NVS2B14_09610 [Chamaesiphon sp.]